MMLPERSDGEIQTKMWCNGGALHSGGVPGLAVVWTRPLSSFGDNADTFIPWLCIRARPEWVRLNDFQ
jgi:hypothetical protein